MLLPITATVAAILTLIFLGLTARVIYGRQSGYGPNIGLGEDETFWRTVRAHTNFTENVPLFLILLGLLEMSKIDTLFLALLSAVFIIGRLTHFYGIQSDETLRFRILGMLFTLAVLLICAITLLTVVF